MRSGALWPRRDRPLLGFAPAQPSLRTRIGARLGGPRGRGGLIRLAVLSNDLDDAHARADDGADRRHGGSKRKESQAIGIGAAVA